MGEFVSALYLSWARDCTLHSIQTNHLGLALLTFLLLPKLIETTKRFSTLPRLVAVSSGVHYWVPFGDDLIEAPNIHKKVSSEEYCTPEYVPSLYLVNNHNL